MLVIKVDLTGVIRKGEKQFVVLCPELDVISQGIIIEKATKNFKEAVELYIEEFGFPEEFIAEEVFITRFDVDYEKIASPIRV